MILSRYYLIIILSLAGLLSAHPHIFIESSILFASNANSITGLRLIWVWDENWSNDIINDCDTDGDGVFNREETALVYENYFSDVKEFDYFTEIFINGKKQPFKTPAGFKASISKKGIVTFDFVLPFTFKPDKTTSVKICFNDKSTYTAFDQNLKLIKSSGYQYLKPSVSVYGDYGVQAVFNLVKE